MAFKPGHVPVHKGRRTTADPITTGATVALVKEHIKSHTRNYALFSIAVNSMLRAGDLCRLTWEHCIDDGDRITIRTLQQKTKKPIVVPLPVDVSTALRAWRAECDSEFVYSGQRGQLTVASWGRMIKAWCAAVGLKGNFASHTARKTGVRVRYDEHDVSLATLMHMLSHTDARTTLIYMGKMDEAVEHAYSVVI